MLCYKLKVWNAKSLFFVFEFVLDMELFGHLFFLMHFFCDALEIMLSDFHLKIICDA